MSKVENLSETEIVELAIAVEVLLGICEILRVVVAGGPDMLVALGMNAKQIESAIASCRRKTQGIRSAIGIADQEKR